MITEIKGTNLIAVDNLSELSKLNIRFKELGTVTKDKIGFDITKLPDMLLTTEEANNLLGKNDKIDFYKLLAMNGIYFENPIKEQYLKDYQIAGFSFGRTGIDYMNEKYDLKSYRKGLNEWQSYEDKIVEKLLIIENIDHDNNRMV